MLAGTSPAAMEQKTQSRSAWLTYLLLHPDPARAREGNPDAESLGQSDSRPTDVRGSSWTERLSPESVCITRGPAQDTCSILPNRLLPSHDDSLYFEDLALGMQWVSRSRHLSEAEISLFSDVVWHLSEGTPALPANGGGHVRRVAPPTFLAAAAVGLGSVELPQTRDSIVQSMHWRFFEPLHAGDVFRVEWRLARKHPTDDPQWGLTVWQAVVTGSRGSVLAEGEMESLVLCNSPSTEVVPVPVPSTPSSKRRRRRRSPGSVDSQLPADSSNQWLDYPKSTAIELQPESPPQRPDPAATTPQVGSGTSNEGLAAARPARRRRRRSSKAEMAAGGIDHGSDNATTAPIELQPEPPTQRPDPAAATPQVGSETSNEGLAAPRPARRRRRRSPRAEAPESDPTGSESAAAAPTVNSASPASGMLAVVRRFSRRLPAGDKGQ